MTLEHLTRETFSAQLNTKFRVTPEAEQVFEFELVEVTGEAATAQQERFSAIFRGPAGVYFPQRIYRMEHEQLGEFELFLVPIRRESDGFYYEAAFNRLR